MVYSRIMKLWKMPDLAHEIESYEPEPDPVQEQMVQMQMENAALENRLLKMQLAKLAKDIESEDSKILERNSRTAQNLQSETEENLATARLKNAQAEKLESETDLLDQKFLKTHTGEDRKEKEEDREVEHLAKQELEAQKYTQNVSETRKENRGDTVHNMANQLAQQALAEDAGSFMPQQPTQGEEYGTL
jgi:hypothetical protein